MVSAYMPRWSANGHQVLPEAREVMMSLLRDLPYWDREVLEANDGVTCTRVLTPL
jgi:hypothetical protein